MTRVHDIIGSTTGRVSARTADHVNQDIRRQTEAALAYFAAHPDEIEQRLGELEREWDIERTLEANAAGVSLVGLALAATVNRRWLVLPIGVSAFLLQHAVQGWCPPVPLFRRLGIRTASEIARERCALMYLRGDFGETPAGETPRERARRALSVVEG